ncbi:MAG: hypothetical protein NT057_06300 [Actinobacteria bacterium]|nr:hypothetical protein [Actinomycetota bacterium]
MKKEIAVISFGIAIAASVLYAELKPASSTPAQVTSVSNSTVQQTPLATPTASQTANKPATPITRPATPITRPATTQPAQTISNVKPTINQNGGGGEEGNRNNEGENGGEDD